MGLFASLLESLALLGLLAGFLLGSWLNMACPSRGGLMCFSEVA